MYKVIVIDDEVKIQQGICTYIRCIDEDFEVVECFDDGETAVEYLSCNDIDVVITDIRMKELSGIDVLQFIYENKPHIKTVVITAYEEFEYAKAAIQYNVKGFITKPTQYTKIADVLKKIRIELDLEKKQQFKLETNKNCLNYLIEILYSSVLNERKVITDDINKMLEIVYDGNHQQLVNSKFCVFELKIENYHDFLENEYEYGHQELNKLLRNFLSCAYDTVNNKFDFYQIDATENILHYITQSSKYKLMDEFLNDLNKHFESTKKSLLSEVNLAVSFSIVKHFNDINEIVDNSTISDSSLDYPKKIIELAINYISEHYGDDISLYTVAKYVNLNSAYFSRFFKKYTGKNFSDFLLDCRMEKAKEMILKNMKINDIAEKVGYRSISYFCKTFKNVTGYTPRQYYIEKQEEN